MFGVANQLLAIVALAVGTTIVINIGRAQYAWVTAVPCAFVTVTTLSAGWLNITKNFWPLTTAADASLHLQGYVNSFCTGTMMICDVIVLVSTTDRCLRVLNGRAPVMDPVEAA
jgi:carbon starvation protein